MPDEQPRSKATKVSGDRKSGVIVKKLTYDPLTSPNSFDSEIPELGQQHPYIDDLYFFDADFQPMPGKFGDLILNYSYLSDDVVETELRTQVKDSPLESNKNYRLKWNNTISSDSETTIPDFWNDAENWDDIKDEEKIKDGTYKVTPIQGGQPLTNIIQERIKKVNSWKEPTYQVLEITYCKEQSAANQRAGSVGTNQEPVNTFGIEDSTLSDWLVTSAPITREGGYWVVRKTYEYKSPFNKYIRNDGEIGAGWDTDFYGDKQ